MKSQHGFAHAFILVGIAAILIGALSVVFLKSFHSADSVTSKTDSKKNDDLYQQVIEARNNDVEKSFENDNLSFRYLESGFQSPSWKVVKDSPAMGDISLVPSTRPENVLTDSYGASIIKISESVKQSMNEGSNVKLINQHAYDYGIWYEYTDSMEAGMFTAILNQGPKTKTGNYYLIEADHWTAATQSQIGRIMLSLKFNNLN